MLEAKLDAILALLSPPSPDPEPDMATITKSIGTSSRDYSTITSWEADLDNGAVYASGDTAVGECYDDSAFDESVTIDGGGTVGLVKTVLTVASGQRHDGTAGTGARIVGTAARGVVLTGHASIKRDVMWLELNENGYGNLYLIELQATIGNEVQSVQNVILHGQVGGSGSDRCIYNNGFGVTNGPNRVTNSIVYDFHQGAGFGGIAGISLNQGDLYNVTIHDGTGASGATATGQTGGSTIQNCVITDQKTACFSVSTDHNASSDSSATGTGSLTSVSAAATYVSTTGGSEDLHLKSGASCIDAGTDLVTTPTNVNIDINGRDRDSNGDTWDIGAHEFVGAAPVGMTLRRRSSLHALLRR